jgi:adenosylmethionine-8-amino-7-oxononanoate aminotransferase
MTAFPSRTPKFSHLFFLGGTRRPRIDRAEGIFMWAEDGRRFIDGSSGAMVSSVGHSTPRVLAEMRAQMERVTFTFRLQFENEAAEELASELVAVLPGDLDRVFFTSGGSESVESAIKLARQYAVVTGRPERSKVISLSPSYHGATLGTLAVGGYRPLVDPFLPMIAQMPKIPAPTAYRDQDSLSMEERGIRYADMLETEILAQGSANVLAFLMEPVGGASTGALVAPDTYYPRVREICDRYGVLLIYDEVMSGAGRTGAYLAAEHWGQVPDIVALSKGFGGGYAPLGAMVTASRLVDPIMAAGGFSHGFTYAGNPLACAAGRAVLAEIVDNDLGGNAAKRGDQLMDRLEGLKSRFGFIGDVRGKGLLTGIELVGEDWAVLPPTLNAHQRVAELAYERGLIIYSKRTRGGYEGDHVMVCPPLIVTDDQIDEIVDILGDALTAFAAEAGLTTS